jgi:hypothetical protein
MGSCHASVSRLPRVRRVGGAGLGRAWGPFWCMGSCLHAQSAELASRRLARRCCAEPVRQPPLRGCRACRASRCTGSFPPAASVCIAAACCSRGSKRLQPWMHADARRWNLGRRGGAVRHGGRSPGTQPLRGESSSRCMRSCCHDCINPAPRDPAAACRPVVPRPAWAVASTPRP